MALDEGTPATGGGGQTSPSGTGNEGGYSGTVAPSTGSTGASTVSANTSPSAAICFGPQAAAPTESVMTFDLGPISADSTNCVIGVPMAADRKLNPAKAYFYFEAPDGTRNEIPYVTTAANCANATTYGGWYATNTSGGPTDIGLCGCSCNAARKHAFHLDVAMSGIPK